MRSVNRLVITVSLLNNSAFNYFGESTIFRLPLSLHVSGDLFREKTSSEG